MGTRPARPESILTDEQRGTIGWCKATARRASKADRDSGFVATSAGMKTLSIWVCNVQWGVALQKLKQW